MMAKHIEDSPKVTILDLIETGRTVGRMIKKLKTPSNPEDYIQSYGLLTFDKLHGFLTFRKKKSIQLRKNGIPYTLIGMLFDMPGQEVLYEDIATKLKLQFTTPKQKRETREKIRLVLRQIRRTFEIDAQKTPEKNIFVMSGKGISLALLD